MTEKSVDRLLAEIAELRANRDEWMDRSHEHAMEADRFRGQIVNLKGRLWELERDMKAKDIVLQCAQQELHRSPDRIPKATDCEHSEIWVGRDSSE